MDTHCKINCYSMYKVIKLMVSELKIFHLKLVLVTYTCRYYSKLYHWDDNKVNTSKYQ